MNRETLEAAAAGGTPFTVCMAEGREHRFPQRDIISSPPNGRGGYVIVCDENDRFAILPLLTVTGLRTLERESERQS